jgi:hypothetical protein
MPGQNDRDRSRGNSSREDDPITERLIDDGDRSPRAIPAAAREAFDEDQRRDPESPTRIRREMSAERGIEDPAHSRGSRPGSAPAPTPQREETHGNRDRSDIKGAPRRPAEQTGERGSGRSATNPPVEERNTRSKQSGA